MIENPEFDNNYYTWSDNPEQALLAIDLQSQESNTAIDLDESEESLDDEQVLTLFEE